MCTVRSASCSAGRPATGRITQFVARASRVKPSSGTGGTAGSEIIERRIHADDQAFHIATDEMFDEPVANFRNDEDRRQPLEGIGCHAGRGGRLR